MVDDTIKTDVDRLIALLHGKEKVLLTEAAEELGVPVETVQSWVDFLVEEGVIGIEYKFTNPYIYLNNPSGKKAMVKHEEELGWDSFHQAFLEKAHEKQIPELKAAALWKSHVLTILNQKKAFFFDEARKRGLANIERLWEEYQKEVLLKI